MLFNVDKITPSSNGGFIVTISEVTTGNTSVKTALGVQAVSEYGKKYSTKVIKPTVTTGQQIDLDIDQFDIVSREFTIDDPTSDRFGEKITAHWLFPKQ